MKFLSILFFFLTFFLFSVHSEISIEEINNFSPEIQKVIEEKIYNFQEIKQNFSKYVVFVLGGGEPTGIIIHKHFIVINNHSAPDCKFLAISLWDGDENIYNNVKFIGHVVAQDKVSDLALVFVEQELPDLPSITFFKGNLKDLETKDIYGIGNPTGWTGSWSYTKGYVSKSPSLCEVKDREIKFISITVALDTFGGSSGSLILNEKGQCIGMTSILLVGTRFTYIIPASTIENFIAESMRKLKQYVDQIDKSK